MKHSQNTIRNIYIIVIITLIISITTVVVYNIQYNETVDTTTDF